MNFGEWKTGIPITSGVYWCQVKDKDGRLFGAALHYGSYDYCPMYADPEEVRAKLRDGQTYDEEENTVYGTGWYDVIEQWECEFEFVTKVYDGDEKVMKYCELPDPRV